MDIAIVGGGASGIMAAYFASSKNNRVRLFEKNEKLGKKIYITGKGRCNITNGADISEFINHVNTNPHFLYSAFYGFTNLDLVNLLERNGLKIKEERGKRLFPRSDKSSDVIKTLSKMLEKKSVDIRLNAEVKSIKKVGNKFILKTDKGEEIFDRLIISTGGLSYPSTGSTGGGYDFAKSLGHKVTELKPGLVPLDIEDFKYKYLQGLTLKNVAIKLKDGKNIIGRRFGDLLFTHKGISGPVIIDISSHLEKNKNYTISIDLKPALDENKLDKRILREIENNSKKTVKTLIKILEPHSLVDLVLDQGELDPNIKLSELDRETRKTIVRTLKGIAFDKCHLATYSEAIITCGGIDTKEIDPSTMESKIVEGLYFSGEILDLDAETGGYNLQIAFSTGYLAGKNAGEE